MPGIPSDAEDFETIEAFVKTFLTDAWKTHTKTLNNSKRGNAEYKRDFLKTKRMEYLKASPPLQRKIYLSGMMKRKEEKEGKEEEEVPVKRKDRANNTAAVVPLATVQTRVSSKPLAFLSRLLKTTPLVPAAAPAAAAAAVPIEGYCPLVNQSNYCYMNATMQLLYSIPELRTVFSSLPDAEIEGSNVLYTEKGQNVETTKHLLQLIQKFISTMINYKAGQSVDMTKLIGTQGNPVYTEIIEEIESPEERVLPVAEKAFYPGKQSAADEFLLRLFAKLFVSELVPIRALRNLFSFDSYKVFICENGKIVPSRIYEDSSIGINFEERPPKSIQDAIKNNEKEERVDLEQPIRGCGEDENAYSTIMKEGYTIHPYTKYLIFFIKRLVLNPLTGRFVKKTQEVNIDSEIVCNGVSFRPSGCVVHQGGATGGHYIFYKMNERGEPILMISDSRIMPASKSNMGEINTNSIVVLYERITNKNMFAVAEAAAEEEANILATRRGNLNSIEVRKLNMNTRRVNAVRNVQARYNTLRKKVSNLQTAKFQQRNEAKKAEIEEEIGIFRPQRNNADAERKTILAPFSEEEEIINQEKNRLLEEIRTAILQAARTKYNSEAEGGKRRKPTTRRQRIRKQKTRKQHY